MSGFLVLKYMRSWNRKEVTRPFVKVCISILMFLKCKCEIFVIFIYTVCAGRLRNTKQGVGAHTDVQGQWMSSQHSSSCTRFGQAHRDRLFYVISCILIYLTFHLSYPCEDFSGDLLLHYFIMLPDKFVCCLEVYNGHTTYGLVNRLFFMLLGLWLGNILECLKAL